jgi:hypothetical protein
VHRRPDAVRANVEPYVRADGTKIWSLMQLERQLRPEAYGPRRPGGYIIRRRAPQLTAAALCSAPSMLASVARSWGESIHKLVRCGEP